MYFPHVCITLRSLLDLLRWCRPSAPRAPLFPPPFHRVRIASTSLPVCSSHFHITPASASYHLHYAMPPTSLLSTPPPPAVSQPRVCSLDFVFRLGLDEAHPSLDVSIIDACYCAPLRSQLIPTRSLARSPLRTSDLKTGGSFPRPRVLTPTLSTAGLASRTETLLQSAPSESHLVRVFMPRQIGRPLCFWAVAWELGPTSP